MTDIGRVLGNYRLVSLLAEGGMSRIYVAAHVRLKRTAAIKLLKPAFQDRPDAVARFVEEARTLHRIRHPNIVESLDLVEDPGAAHCVLELLQGPSLEQRIAGGRLPLASTIRIAIQICEALAAVHVHGIVHRDLKPQNLILVEREGRDDFVKLIDFGVAQMGATDVTPGFGTAAYMAPEQAAGERVDARADVYALGVLMFEMATGRHPFPSTSDSEYTLRHHDEVPRAPSKLDRAVPAELDKIILRCLAKRPADRYASAAAVGDALRALEQPAKRRARAPLAIAGVAAIAAAAIVVVIGMHEERRPTPVTLAPVAPPSPPVPVKPMAVTLTFHSEPAGAQVFRAGETIALGVTPFQIELRAGASTPMRFELAGYEPLEALVSLVESGTVEVTLDKRRPSARPAKKPRAKQTPLSREGTMNPFGT